MFSPLQNFTSPTICIRVQLGTEFWSITLFGLKGALTTRFFLATDDADVLP